MNEVKVEEKHEIGKTNLTKQLEEDGGELRASFKRISSSKEIDELLAAMDKLAAAGDLSADAQKEYNKAIQKRQNTLDAEESKRIIDDMTTFRTNYVQYGASSDTED